MSSSPEVKIFKAVLPTLNEEEARRVIEAQMKSPLREVMCVFNAGKDEQTTATRSPYLHSKNEMLEGVLNLIADMQKADLVFIKDITPEV